MGAAYLAGLAVGYWKDLNEIRANWGQDRLFTPAMEAAARRNRLRDWTRAVSAAICWAKDSSC